MNDNVSKILLLSHLTATLFMLGVIWFVQIVHYPLFATVGGADFHAYEQRHTALTTWVVAPPMLLEAFTALLIFWFRPIGVEAWQLWIGLTLLVIIWLSTALIQVPCHEMLSQGFDPVVHQRLVTTNWIRTIAWSSRGLLVVWMAMSVSL